MKRMRRIKALEDNSTQMMRSKRPTVEEVVAARVSKIRFQLIGKIFFFVNLLLRTSFRPLKKKSILMYLGWFPLFPL